MNICFLHSGFSIHGGIERVLSIVAPALEQRGIAKVHCLALVEAEPLAVYALPNSLRIDSLFREQINMRGALQKGGIGRLVRYLKENQIHVVIACGAIYYPMACIGGRLAGSKVICWEHTNPGKANEVAFENIGRRFGAMFSHRNMLVSQGAYDYYCKHYRKKRNVLVYNPAADELFEKTEEYNKESHAFISVGRLSYPKNYPLLIDIAARILGSRDDWCWDIYGEGEERPELERKIAEKGLQGKVVLKGAVNDLYSRYCQYAAIVMTSRFEGFPMVLIEAAAKGLPMVSFDIKTGPSEIIRHGVNGYLIPDGDVEDMIEKLELLMRDCALRCDMSSQTKDVVEPFRLNHVCLQWQSLLEELKR